MKAEDTVYAPSGPRSIKKDMWLSKESLEEFKAICRDEFGVELNDVEAHQRALEVLDLFSLLFVEGQTDASDKSADFDSTEGGQVS